MGEHCEVPWNGKSCGVGSNWKKLLWERVWIFSETIHFHDWLMVLFFSQKCEMASVFFNITIFLCLQIAVINMRGNYKIDWFENANQ